MTILLTADLHFTDAPADSYKHQFPAMLCSLLKKHRVDALYVLGDLTEHKAGHTAALVNQIASYFYAWAQICPVLTLRGNHDGLDPANSFFAFLGLIKNVGWINDPYEQDGHLFLPHTRDYKRDWKNLDLKQRFIFMHNTVEGANSNGHKLEGIPTKIFGRDSLVLSGDVHTPQTVDMVTYVGAPYTVYFGDTFKPRVVLLDGTKVTSIPIPGPQKRMFDITWPCTDLKAEIKRCMHKQQSAAGDIVKIRVEIAQKDIAEWHSVKERTNEAACKLGLQVYNVIPFSSFERGSAKPINTTKQRVPDDKIVTEFGKSRKIDKHTLKTGLNLLSKA
jgi:predicted phosphodiesterase